MQQIIDAYVELLELRHHSVLTQVKLVNREHVCVELIQAVLEALRHQRVTLPIAFANVERLQIALQTQQHQHAMNQIIDVFVGQLVRQHPDAQYLVKLVSQELACVEPQHLVMETG